MKRSDIALFVAACSLSLLGTTAMASGDDHLSVGDEIVIKQRAVLAASTDGAGFGPQSPRDIDAAAGNNQRSFSSAPSHTLMNICNIHFHENAEHKGGEFTTYAGNGDGHGYDTGFKYDGTVNEAEMAPLDHHIGESEHGDLEPGDTIEVHFVHTTAQVTPGPTLGSCLSDSIGNPQLRVEAVVMVLVNDEGATDFMEMAHVERVDDYYQAPHIPTNLGKPVQYTGSTTGPGYNEKGSPFQVSWSVRPNVAHVNIHSVGAWLEDNIFDEDHAHGVRNLVMNPDLLSPISH